MKHFKLYIIPLFLFAIYASSCKETLEIDDNILGSVQAPQITGISPLTGSAGDEITLTGKGFAIADTVYVNGIATKIKNRVSDNSLIIELTGMEVSGKIKVVNSKGSGESTETFAMIYKQPESVEISIDPSELLVSGTPLDITGENLRAVDSIFLSGESNRVAKILFKTDTKITIDIPVTCDVQAVIKLKYYEKSTPKYWSSTVYNTDKVIIPPVVSNCPEVAYVGQAIYIETTNADRIDSVYFAEKSVKFELVSDNTIKAILPKEYTGNTSGSLAIMHNACEEEVLVDNFKLIYPLCYSNFDMQMSAQCGNGGSTGENAPNAFFDAESGGTYTTCEAIQHPQDIEFITYSNTNGAFVFYGPHSLNSNTIKNFYCGTTALNATGGMDLSLFNAVTVKFKVLKETNANELALIEKYNNYEIVDITDDLFAAFSETAQPSSNSISYYKNNTAQNSTYKPGDVIWFKNSFTGKNGLLRVNSVSYSGTAQDKFSTGQLDVLYQR